MTGLELLVGGSLLGNTIGTIWNAFQGKKTSDKNYDMQREQLNYQKYLNNNQIQMQTADALKAGINPMALNPGNLSSGNYSNIESPQADLSGMNSIITQMMSNASAQKIADKQAESAAKVARINAMSAERQTQMKINADTETQKTQNLWQSLKNMEQRIFEANQNRLGRKNAKEIAENSTKTMKDIAEMNNNLQKWINTYQIPNDDDNNEMNILSAQQNLIRRQLQDIAAKAALDNDYRSKLFDLQKELQQLQEDATKAGIRQGYINAIGNAIGSVGNLINSIGNFGKPSANIYNTGDTYKTTNIDNLYGR